MSFLVVDTSVAFKWLIAVDEESVEDAEALLDAQRAGEVVLAAPSTLTTELANSLRYRKHLAREETLMIVEELDSLQVELFPTVTQRVHPATVLAYRHGITVYDALFLQLAEELDCPLVTADRRAFAGLETDVEIRLL